MAVLYEEDLPILMAEINKRINEKVGKEYSFIIDQSKSDPVSIITLNEVYEPSTPAEWMTALGIKPCVVHEGTVLYYLNPNNFRYTADGINADIVTPGNDVMIEIPRMGIRCVKLSDTRACVTITKKSHATGFDYRAFSCDTYNDSSKLYVGAYEAYAENDKLYSVSGKVPTTGAALGTYRKYAKARGIGYGIVTYSIDTLLQCIYCLIFRHTNSQSVVGSGYTVASHVAPLISGGSDAYGMNSELCTGSVQTDANHHVKFCGLESFWGNTQTLEDGIGIDSMGNIKLAPTVSACNDTFNKYEVVAVGPTTNYNGFVSKMLLANGAIFVPTVVEGSSASYYSDYGSFENRNGVITAFGGYYASALYSGVFYRNSSITTTASPQTCGSRLIYLAR